MHLSDLIGKTGQWLKGTGPYSGIVISSRIRLARNISNIPFSGWDKKARESVLGAVSSALQHCNVVGNGLFLEMHRLNELQRQFLLERHLISKEHMVAEEAKAVAISADERVSIMINEEDHLRLQVIESGFSLQDVWSKISGLDDILAKDLDYAYSTDFGFLTACPTNTGTGMRGSVMLHLPALVMTKKVNNVLQAIVKIGLAARGFYGEGSEALGNFFQISNQITLGYKEEDILNNLERVVKQIIDHEQGARQNLYKNNKVLLEDKIWRSYGLLKSSYIITSKEAIDLLSSVRLGVDLGFITDIDTKRLNELFIIIQPAHLQEHAKKALSSSERDVLRAQLIREKFDK